MAKALDILRKLATRGTTGTQSDCAFDLRLKKLGGVRKPHATRAVLFRTRPAPRAA